MSDLTLDRPERAARSGASVDLYRAVWRWHFYAGLFVLPFLVTLSITGGLYVFRDEIDALVHSDLKRVATANDTSLARPSAMVDAALAAHPGTALKFTDPASPDASAEVTVRTDAGERLAVYVDPHDARVLGALPDQGTIMWTVRHLHSLKFFGPVARGAVEIAAGWSVLLVITGIYLWWPRGQAGGVVTVRGTPARRVFWRDAHAVTGIAVGGFLVFLAVTGMPWSQVWGGQVNQWANGSNFGYPSGVRVDVPMSGQRLSEAGTTSWSMQEAQVPESAPSSRPSIGLNAAVATFDRLGLHHGYAVALPTTPTGVYTGSVYPDDVAEQRVVHLDRYTGDPLLDMRYADYGPLGRALEWGISVHLGQQFGLPNQIVLVLVCIGNVVLAVSAGAMWWKRRPSRSMGVPPMPRDPRVFRGLLALLAIGGVVFPLVGASLLVMLALDLAVARMRRRPAAA
ncbi:PepSY domain-containing protein [Aureimonas flava]|uniref:PepSY domain-containing protein n=1 Tax=Aureimonas flava TaxID=2320271 RepID=A0A3A1WRZ4_9HYPH|nr:PepSY domain-containing protein [Aureimonas flava]RIY03455.1 PepSY domain-containing protein [Aureimonas flava]